MADAPKWKICWITGATGGIGAELSRRLAERGVKVAATARSEDKLKALAVEAAEAEEKARLEAEKAAAEAKAEEEAAAKAKEEAAAKDKEEAAAKDKDDADKAE